MKLFRLVGTALGIGVALGLLLVPLVLFLVKFDNATPIGKAVKSRFIHYPRLVTIANLNEPGDARYGYLNSDTSAISVRVMLDPNVEMDPRIREWVGKMVRQTTGKAADIAIEPELLPDSQATYSTPDLNRIRDRFTRFTSDGPVLNIVYLTASQDKVSYAGLTLHRDTIFLFKKTMEGLAGNDTELTRLEQSTLFHEWGHLLGMEHNDFDNCIMSATVDVYEGIRAKNSFVTDYCWNELYQLEQMRNTNQ